MIATISRMTNARRTANRASARDSHCRTIGGVLSISCRAGFVAAARGAGMSQPPSEAGELLGRIVDATPQRRAHIALEAGSPNQVILVLAAEVEKLAMTRVSAALDASAVMVELADDIGGPPERARVRRARAQALAYGGRFTDSLPIFEEATRIAETGGAAVEAAQCRLASIHALVHLARYEDAIAAGESARATFIEAGVPVLAGRADSSLGGVRQKMDDSAAALAHFDRARSLLRGDPVALAQLESNRGLALQSMDDLAGAEAAFLAAIPAFAAADLSWASAIVEGNLAVLATRQGRLQPALRFFERARRHLEADAAPAELARTLVEQAEALTTLRMLEMAASDYETALPLLEEHGQVREAIQARAGLGRAFALMGRLSEAEPLLSRAADEYERMGQRVERARLDLVRAEIRHSQANYAQASEIAQASLDELLIHPIDAAVARYHLARAAWATDGLETALREINAAVSSAEELGVTPLLADLLHLRGLIHRDSRRRAQSIEDFARAVDCVERVRGTLQAERFQAAFHGNRLVAYEDLVLAAIDGDDARQRSLMFSTIERAKSRALLDLVGGAVWSDEIDVVRGGDRTDAALAAGLDRLGAELNAAYSRLADSQSDEAPSVPSRGVQEKIALLERRLEAMEGRLANTRGAASLRASTVELQTLQDALDPGVTLVEYFSAADQLLALVISRDSIRSHFPLVSVADVQARVQRLYFQLRRALRPGAADGRRSGRLVADARVELEALYAAVLAPMRDAIDSSDRLVFVPHGCLHAVPFQALWDGSRHLIEQFEVCYGPSASVLARMRKQSHERTAGTGALVVGVADERAPLIDREAKLVAAALAAGTVLIGEEATTSRVQAAASRARVIHLACHGYFSRDYPLGSGIKLADRWLSVREICELGLSADLVTLAACETGRTLIGVGDELLGLIRGFIAAGARTLIASQWIANDEISAKLMTSLYNDLGMGRDDAASAALRAAQLESLADHPHPALWAPYILVGGL